MKSDTIESERGGWRTRDAGRAVGVVQEVKLDRIGEGGVCLSNTIRRWLRVSQY